MKHASEQMKSLLYKKSKVSEKTYIRHSFKITVPSIIDFGLILYHQSCTDKEKGKYDQIQYNAAKLVTSTLPCTSKEKVFVELGWEAIKDMAYILGISLFHKIVKQETLPLVKSMLPDFTSINIHNLRSARTLKPFPFKGVKYSNSFYPFFTKKYNSLAPKTRQMSIDDFKLEIRTKNRPPRLKQILVNMGVV